MIKKIKSIQNSLKKWYVNKKQRIRRNQRNEQSQTNNERYRYRKKRRPNQLNESVYKRDRISQQAMKEAMKEGEWER